MSKPTTEKLTEMAASIRGKVPAASQDEIFRTAAAAAHVASRADGKIDDAERQAMIAALEQLSGGSVIEWEVDMVVQELDTEKGGAEAKAKAVGGKLKALGQAEAGLLVAAYVAQATDGIDKKEAKLLTTIGKAAGVADKRIKEILAEVGAEASDD